MTKRPLLLLIPFLFLVACGDDDYTEPEPVPSSQDDYTRDVKVDWAYYTVQTPDGPLDCAYGTSGKGYNGGPSCNWEKFNQEHDGDE